MRLKNTCSICPRSTATAGSVPGRSRATRMRRSSNTFLRAASASFSGSAAEPGASCAFAGRNAPRNSRIMPFNLESSFCATARSTSSGYFLLRSWRFRESAFNGFPISCAMEAAISPTASARPLSTASASIARFSVTSRSLIIRPTRLTSIMRCSG